MLIIISVISKTGLLGIQCAFLRVYKELPSNKIVFIKSFLFYWSIYVITAVVHGVLITVWKSWPLALYCHCNPDIVLCQEFGLER